MTTPSFLSRTLRPLVAALPLSLTLATGAAHADDTPPKCLYVEIATIPIHYAGVGLAPAVDGVINGKPGTMLADTGAFETQLTLAGAVRRDLNLSMTGRYAEGVAGYQRLYATRVNDFSIGPAKSPRSLNVLVINQDDLQYDAIVGAPFLLQTDMEIDLRAKRMRFFRQRDCGRTPLILWKETTVAVPFVPHRDRSPNPHFTVLVNGKELDAMIDTGAHHTTLFLSGAKSIGLDVNGPDARRLGEMGGIGSEHAAHWGVKVKTFQIGDETIKDAEIGVLDNQGEVATDILLGQDFLRAHRVLFAMSQQKVYFAYLGGDAFSMSYGMPDWVRAEAEAGTPDAQYVLARAYGNGNGVPRDLTQAKAWREKAAAGGQANAKLELGRQALLAGHADAAIPLLRSGLDALPANHLGPLWLYLARLRNGEAALARTELAATTKRRVDPEWPDPIADYYLGNIDAARLLAEAGKDKTHAHAQTCLANDYIAELAGAQGDQAKADALMAQVRTECRPARPAAAAAAKVAPAPQP